MRFLRKFLLFLLGGSAYMGLEYLWRGWSHISMFLAGGTAFLLLGKLRSKNQPLPLRALEGSGIITGVELAAGLLVNRGYRVWDYRGLPLNFLGQICLPFSLLWIPVGLAGMRLYAGAEKYLKARL